MANLNIRQVSVEIGISAATLSRIENGKPCDGKTVARLLVWLTTEVHES